MKSDTSEASREYFTERLTEAAKRVREARLAVEEYRVEREAMRTRHAQELAGLSKRYGPAFLEERAALTERDGLIVAASPYMDDEAMAGPAQLSRPGVQRARTRNREAK